MGVKGLEIRGHRDDARGVIWGLWGVLKKRILVFQI